MSQLRATPIKTDGSTNNNNESGRTVYRKKYVLARCIPKKYNHACFLSYEVTRCSGGILEARLKR